VIGGFADQADTPSRRNNQEATITRQQQEDRSRMFSSIVLYTRMMIELVIALFITGLLAAFCGGSAYGLAHLAGFSS
jgi:hypothetical protein